MNVKLWTTCIAVLWIAAVVLGVVSGDLILVVILLALAACVGMVLHITSRTPVDLVKERDRVQQHLNIAATLIMHLDRDGTVRMINREGCEIIGFEREEIVGQNFFQVAVPEALREERKMLYAQLLQNGIPEDMPPQVAVICTKGNEPRFLSWRLAPLYDDHGKICGVIASGEDVTDKQEVELEREKAEKMKEEFFALVSHELRTPLTSIIGYTELLSEGAAGELEPPQEKFLITIDRNAKRLLRLVGDLLFAAQLEAATMRVHKSVIQLDEIVQDAVEAVMPRGKDSEVTIIADTPAIPMTGDPDRLSQLINNLVSNAIKFTPQGGSVIVRARQEATCIVLEVIDTGVGMEEEDRKQLFQRFFRASTATDNAIQGVGLGLVIAKAITEAHQGYIEVESQVGKGTTFRITFSAEKEEQ